MTYNETTTSLYNRMLLFLSEDTPRNFLDAQVYLEDESQTTQWVTSMQFFQNHLEIYEVLRVITRITNKVNNTLVIQPYNAMYEKGESSVEKDTITYHIEQINPARINQDDAPARFEVKPRHRYNIKIVHDSDDIIYPVYGQLIDHVVRFQFFGKTVTSTEEIMVLFRKLMEVFAGAIMSGGVPVFQFIQGGQLNSSEVNRKFKRMPLFLDYLIRTEDLYVMQDPILKAIQTEVRMLT